METKHTPGEHWVVLDTHGLRKDGQATARVVIAHQTDGDWQCTAYVFGRTDEERDANARLYATAPKLLAALTKAKAAIYALHGAPGWAEYQHSPEMQAINSALADATGTQMEVPNA